MKAATRCAAVILAVLAIGGGPGEGASPLAAQELRGWVSEAGDATAQLRYPAREGVEICTNGLQMRHGDSQRVRVRGRWEEPRCEEGPIHLELRVRDGWVRGVEVLDLEELEKVGTETVDLGLRPGEEVVEFLEWIAREGGVGDGAEEAVFPMVVADVQEVWRPLLALARDRALPEDVRTDALFWVSQEATQVVTAELSEVAADEEEDGEVREAAVFALSQRPDGEGVPHLMDLARTAEHADTRASALFWLAQEDRPEVVSFFEEILRGG